MFAAAIDSPLCPLAAWAGQVIQILAKADGDQYQAVAIRESANILSLQLTLYTTLQYLIVTTG